MKYRKLIAIVGYVHLVLVGCQHVLTDKDLDVTYSKVVKELSISNSFAFEEKGHKYYFAPLLIEVNGYRCEYYLGFKDEKQTYKFLSRNLYALKKIYEEKIDVKTKMEKVLSKIEQLPIETNLCNEKTGYKYQGKTKEAVGNTLTFIVYSPLFLVGVVFGADVIADGIRDSLFESKLKNVRLGMTSQQVNNLLGSTATISQDDNLEIQTVRRKSRSLVFIYEKSKLIAYVWGYAKQTAQ